MNALTTFSATDAGADVRQTLNRVLGRVFDVTLYGAKNDGTDATAGIDAAVAALATVGGGTLFFPPGVYLYTKPRFRLTTSNTWIEGPGATLTFNSQTANLFGRILFDGGATSGTITNVGIRGTGFTARDISTADGDNPVPAAGDGQPYASSCNIVVMRGCADFAIDGGVYAGSRQWTINVIRSRDGRIVGTTLRDAYADGVHIHSDSHHILVAFNDIYGCADDAIAVGFNGLACTDILITSNRIHDTGNGIAIYGAESGKTDRIKITNNALLNTYGLGIKCAPACYTGDNDSPYKAASVGTVESRGNSLVGIGMRTTGQNRGGGTTYPINPLNFSGTVDTFISDGDRVDASRNNAVRCEPGGVVTNLIIRDLDVGTMAAYGANVNSPTGGGHSPAPPDNNQADIVTANSTNVFIRGCTKQGLPMADVPALSGGSAAPATSTVIASDDFTRADVAPVTGGLGKTATGDLTWYGDPAGIAGNQAYLAPGGYKQQQVAITGDVDASIDVTITSTANPAGLQILTPNGSQLLLATDGNFIYYDNTTGGLTGFAGNGFAAKDAGTYALRIVRKGNAVSGYVNGAPIGTSTVVMDSTSGVGFQDRGGAGGTARYDNFRVATTV